MNIKTELLNYENRLLQDRKLLNDLIYDLNQNPNDAIIKDKINFLQTEINYMNNQLNLVKQTIYQTPNQTYYQPKQIPIQNTTQNIQISKPNKDIEKTIGKSWMGIFASILIFISIIMFATLVLPILGDTFKMIIMYIFSIGLSSFSIYKLKNNPNNKLFLSLSGCGLGSVYISLLLTNMYFQAIGDITLYIGIAIWGFIICFLSILNTTIFQIIGNIGITISLIFGSILCMAEDDAHKFVILVIFYLVTSIVFTSVHFNKEYNKNIISNLSTLLNSIILIIPSIIINEIFVSILMLIYIAIYIIIFALKTKSNEKSIVYGLFNVGFTNVFMLYDLMFIEHFISIDKTIYFSTFYLLCIGLFIISELKLTKYNKYIVEINTMLQLFIMILALSKSLEMIVIPCILFMIYFSIKKNEIFRITSIIYTILFLSSNVDSIIYFVIFGIILLTIESYSLAIKYNKWIRNILIFGIYLFIIKALIDLNIFCIDIYIFVIISVLHLIICKTILSKNFITKELEKDTNVYLSIINAILMFIGCIYISEYTFLHFFVILTTIALFCNNCKNLLQSNNKLIQVYIPIKFTILLIVILTSFDTLNLIISISCLVFAILSIVFGFKYKYKVFRVYGLILANISVIKMILIDITHNNTMQLALSFFICGILCFTISFIYNRLETKNNIQKE